MTRPPATPLVLALVVSAAAAAGCYATTPHRAEVVTPMDRPACLAAVGEVFVREGFVQRSASEGYTMLFTRPAFEGGWRRPISAATGVGIHISETVPCRVVLEAVSRDEASYPYGSEPPPGKMTPAAGYDAEIDALARHLRRELSPGGTVN